MTLVLHPSQQNIFDHLTKTLPNSLLIVGKKGRGAASLADEIARIHSNAIYSIVPEKDEKPDPNGTISIDRIRELHVATRSSARTARVIRITDAHKMTPQAQNSFLKLLEEPNLNTHFVLSAHTTQGILSTVLSRVQTVDVKPITKQQSEELLDQLGLTDAKMRAQALFIAAGNPADLARIASEPSQITDYSARIADAKIILQGSAYEKIRIISSYKDDRAKVLILLELVMKLLRMSLASAPDATALTNKLEKTLAADERIRANGNVRLVLLDFVL